MGTQLFAAARKYAASLEIIRWNVEDQAHPNQAELATCVYGIQIDDWQIVDETLHTDVYLEETAVAFNAPQAIHRNMQASRFGGELHVARFQEFRLLRSRVAITLSLILRRQILIIWNLKSTH